MQAVAQDQPVGPVHVVLVELHRLAVLQLRVGEERPLRRLAQRQLQDGLRRDPLVDVQRDRVDVEPTSAPACRPTPATARGRRSASASSFASSAVSARWRAVSSSSGSRSARAGRVEAQDGRQVRVVGVAGLRDFLHLALRGQAGRRDVLALVRVAVVGHRVGRRSRGGRSRSELAARHGRSFAGGRSLGIGSVKRSELL